MVQKGYAAPRSKRAKSVSRPHYCDDIWDEQKAFFFFPPKRLARHRRCYEAAGFQYLDCADRRSGRLHTSYYAAINEQPSKIKRGQMAHTLTNTLARTLTQVQRLAHTHGRLKGHPIHCVYTRKIFEGDVLPVAKERTQKETPLHTTLHQS